MYVLSIYLIIMCIHIKWNICHPKIINQNMKVYEDRVIWMQKSNIIESFV